MLMWKKSAYISIYKKKLNLNWFEMNISRSYIYVFKVNNVLENMLQVTRKAWRGRTFFAQNNTFPRYVSIYSVWTPESHSNYNQIETVP